MLTLIENADIFDPEPRGVQSLLIVGESIARVGSIDRHALERSDLEIEIIDGTDCIAAPGLIDPHEHLIGGSGERGFQTQTPEIFLHEIVSGGITTVVGCLGVDTTTKTMPALLARAKALRAEGLTAFIWSGGYDVPPRTLTGSIRSDLLFIDEVIGAGEIAISDVRATQPTAPELARLISDARVGGLLSGKAGVTHFHVGDDRRGLQPLREVLDAFAIEPEWLYPTHVERRRELLREAADFTRLGSYVDIDTMQEDLHLQLRCFLQDNGDLARLTVSSDAAISSPRTLLDQICACVKRHRFTLEQVLPLVTLNTARALRLERKGRIAPGSDADLILLDRGSLELRHLFARGRQMMKDGEVTVSEQFLQYSNRSIALHGGKQRQ